MNNDFYAYVGIFVPIEGQKLGQYEGIWNSLAGEKVLSKMCNFYSLPQCYPLPDGTMGRSNYGRETYAGRVCAKLINELEKFGYSLNKEYAYDDSFTTLADRYVYPKKGYNISYNMAEGVNVSVTGNDMKYFDVNFSEYYKTMKIKPCQFAELSVGFKHLNYNVSILMMQADAVKALKETAKIFNRKYIIEIGHNAKYVKYNCSRFVFPDEKLVLFGKLKKNKEELGELSDMITVHLSENGKTTFSVPFGKIHNFCNKVSNDLIDFNNTDIVPLSKVMMLAESLRDKKPVDLSLTAIRYEQDSEKQLGVKR